MRHFLAGNGTNLISQQSCYGNCLPIESYKLNLIAFSSPMDEYDRSNISCAQAVLWQITAKDHLVQLLYGLHKRLHIHLFYLWCPVHDEREAGLDVLAHQGLDRGFGAGRVFDRHP